MANLDFLVYSLLQRVLTNQVTMIGMLTQILAKETKMALALDNITAAVAADTTVVGSVQTLLTQLTAMIAAIPPSTDPTTQAALDALATQLGANNSALAAAVAANTPAVAPAP